MNEQDFEKAKKLGVVIAWFKAGVNLALDLALISVAIFALQNVVVSIGLLGIGILKLRTFFITASKIKETVELRALKEKDIVVE